MSRFSSGRESFAQTRPHPRTRRRSSILGARRTRAARVAVPRGLGHCVWRLSCTVRSVSRLRSPRQPKLSGLASQQGFRPLSEIFISFLDLILLRSVARLRRAPSLRRSPGRSQPCTLGESLIASSAWPSPLDDGESRRPCTLLAGTYRTDITRPIMANLTASCPSPKLGINLASKPAFPTPFSGSAMGQGQQNQRDLVNWLQIRFPSPAP